MYQIIVMSTINKPEFLNQNFNEFVYRTKELFSKDVLTKELQDDLVKLYLEYHNIYDKDILSQYPDLFLQRETYFEDYLVSISQKGQEVNIRDIAESLMFIEKNYLQIFLFNAENALMKIYRLTFQQRMEVLAELQVLYFVEKLSIDREFAEKSLEFCKINLPANKYWYAETEKMMQHLKTFFYKSE